MKDAQRGGAPPGNDIARMAAGDTKTIRLTAAYLTACGSQAQFKAWQREAARLAQEYLRSGREVHRLALLRHLTAMLLRPRRMAL
jgi:hypothetical protein